MHRSSQVLAAALFSWWITTSQSWGQSHEAAFGLYHSFPTPGTFEQTALLATSPVTNVVLWNRRSSVVTIGSMDSSAASVSYRTHAAPSFFDTIFLEDLNGDGAKDLLFINLSERRISIVVDVAPDTLRAWSILTTAVVPVGVLSGDINNDRVPDLLVFDRETPGIVPYFGRGGGVFKLGKVIYPDTPVGEAVLTHLNNDALQDLVLYDWVKSEIHFLYGVGMGAYLDQASLPVEGDVRKIFMQSISPHRHLDMALLLHNPSRIEWWDGNGLGDFHKAGRLMLEKPVTDILLTDVTHDGLPDALWISPAAGLGVSFNVGSEFAPEREEFAAGMNPVSLLVADVTRNGHADALILDQGGGQILLLESGLRTVLLRDSLEYAMGLTPQGVILNDLNGDGRTDIAVVNGRSHSLTLFENRGDEGIARQSSFPVAEYPRHLGFHSVTDSLAGYLISYPQSNQLSFFTLDLRDRTTVNSVIPTTGGTELLYWDQTPEGLVSFYSYSSSTSKTTPALTFFQQLGPQKFIERNFRLTIPNALLGAAVSDLNNDGFVDASYLFRNSLGRFELAVALGDSALSFRQKVFSYEWRDSLIQQCYFWSGDCTEDSIPDILLSFPHQVKMMTLVRGKGDGTFHRPDTVATGLMIRERSQVYLLDLDGDGALDIIAHELSRGSVGWLRGQGNGTFEDFESLLSVPEGSFYSVGDITGDGVNDIAVTYPRKGTLKLYNGESVMRKTRR